jgi:rhodanese-related sulfurtransferase
MLAAPLFADDIRSRIDEAALADDKRTKLELYLTAEDAHRALQADPDIVFIDVRDPNEVDFVGHPTSVDAIVPLLLATHDFVAEEGSYAMARNDDFTAQVRRVVERQGASMQSPIFVICRSGARDVNGWRTADLPWT